MTHQQFLGRLGLIGALGFVLSSVLRLSLGARWFEFYGWATVALAAVPFVTWLLWTRLPAAGQSRWWSLVFAVPAGLAAITQIAFWHLFFTRGTTNPMFGVMREMVRPWVDTGEPFALAAFAAVCLWLLIAATRNAAAPA